MKCPYCSSEIADDALSCPSCHAMQVVQRTPFGIVVGWLGIILGVQVVLAWPLMLVANFFATSVPWQVLVMVIGATLVTAGLFWYSDKTKHFEWIPPRD